MTLDGIYNNFTKTFNKAMSDEKYSIKRLGDEIEKDFSPIFKDIYPNYEFKIEIYCAVDAGILDNDDYCFLGVVGNSMKEYFIELSVFDINENPEETLEEKINNFIYYSKDTLHDNINDFEDYELHEDFAVYANDFYKIGIGLTFVCRTLDEQIAEDKLEEIIQKLKEPFLETLKGKVLTDSLKRHE